MTRFAVATDFLAAYETHQVGDRTHIEYWIPADELGHFNAAIDRLIEVVAEYHNGKRTS